MAKNLLPESVVYRLRSMDPSYIPRWSKPDHKVIEKRCENFRCLAKISLDKRFCSDSCWRSLLTKEELNLAIGMEVRDDQTGLGQLADQAVERVRKLWLENRPKGML